jgi:cytochrome c2
LVSGLVRTLGAVLCSTALVGAVALGESALFFPVTTRTVDVAFGKSVFQRRCASCHSVEEGRSSYGPCLYKVGEWAATRKPDTAADEYIIESIVSPGAFRAPGVTGEMPENIAHDLSDKELLSVAAYLCSQGGQVHYPRLLKLLKERPEDAPVETITLDLASVERGQAIFMSDQARCMHCHSLDPYPGNDLLAPSLLEVGRHKRAYLEDKLIHPSKEIIADYKVSKLIAGGVPYEGRKLKAAEGEVKLLMDDGKGNLITRTFRKADLTPFDDGEVVQESAVSSMPSYESALSAGERKAVVDFLLTLR